MDSGSTTGAVLTRNLVVLTRALRASGIAVDPGQGIDLQRAVERIDCTNWQQFYLAARAIFVRRLEDIAIFDRAYAYFWRDLRRKDVIPTPSVIGTDESEELPPLQVDETFDQQLEAPNPLVDSTTTRLDAGPIENIEAEDGMDIPATEEPIPIRTYSRSETLRQQSFEHFTHSELEAAREILKRMRWQVGSRALRRMRVGSRGRQLDLRSMVQRSLRSAGEIASLRWRIPKTKPRPLVILGDISGSMERYTRLLIQFFYASRRGRKDVEVFTFGTRLTRITRDLEHRNIDEALRRVAAHVVDWSGGTRIGVCPEDVQSDLGSPSPGTRVRHNRGQRWLGPRRHRPAASRNGQAAASKLPADLGKSAPWDRRLRASDRRHAGGSSLHRRFRPREQRRQPGRPRQPTQPAGKPPAYAPLSTAGWVAITLLCT